MAEMAMAEGVGRQRRTGTERLFAGFWEPRVDEEATARRYPRQRLEDISTPVLRATMHAEAVGESLLLLFEALDRSGRELGEGPQKLYLAMLESLTRDECIRAFSQAVERSRYFPTPAELRRYAFPAEEQDACVVEAMVALRRVFDAIRKFGPELRPIPGKVLRDKDEQGFVLVKPEREPEQVHEGFDGRTETALLALGFGNRQAGLKEIYGHPSVRPDFQQGRDEAATAGFRAKNAADVEKRWVTAFLATASKNT